MLGLYGSPMEQSIHGFPRRVIGSSGIEVSELGLGCNRIGEKMLSSNDWIALLHRAVSLGVAVFDTAAQYAGRQSEELVGKAFGNRQDVVIATKVSDVKCEGKPAFSKNVVMEGAERSLRILNRDCIDIFQTHGSGSLDEVSNSEWAEAMTLLKTQGKIRLRGASVSSVEAGIYVIENGLVDVLQITYNLIDADEALPVMALAHKHGVGLLARMPYQRGILTGKFSPSDTELPENRARFQGETLMRDILAAEKFRELGENRPGGMAALAMQFVLAEKRISCTIPGARSVEQLEANVAAAAAPILTEDELSAVREIHKQISPSMD